MDGNLIPLSRGKSNKRKSQTLWKSLRPNTTNSNIPVHQRLLAMRQLLEMGEITTVEPFLPLFFSLRGEPYTLDDHSVFSPMFRMMMPRKAVYKTARQVGKTTDVAASALVKATCIPNFTNLFVCPLFEQTRRLSGNFIKPFVDQSPLRSLWIDTNTEKSVLQRSFVNNSKLIFSFACLDADRVRGISADSLSIDESFCYETTYVKTPAGEKLLRDVEPGELVLSFLPDGALTWDRVVKNSDHGYRACWTIHTCDGYQVTCTADSWIATTKGWYRVGALIREIANSHQANAPRYSAGDWGHQLQDADVSRQTCVETPALHLDQVPDFIRVREAAAQESEERQLRALLERIPHTGHTGIQLLTGPMLRRADDTGRTDEARQNCYKVLAQRDRRCGLLGDRGLVGWRRRQPTAGRHGPRYTQLHKARSRATHYLAKLTRAGRAVKYYLEKDENSPVLHHSGVGGVDARTCCEDQATHAGVHGVQGYVVDETTPSGLQVLRGYYDFAAELPAAGNRQTRMGVFEKLLQESVQQYSTVPNDKGKATTQTPAAMAQVSQRQTTPQSAQQTQESKTLCEQSRKSECKQTRCVPSEISRITYAGIRHVGDLETAQNHTFVANGVSVHNCQDMRDEHLPVIREVLSASRWGIQQFTGTPKSLSNPIENLWQQSSQAEWFIRCRHCNFYNIPSLEFHLEKMVGPFSDNISEERPGTICFKCGKPVSPRHGFWVHRHKEKMHQFAGYHIPQIIMPMHYSSPAKWAELLMKQEGGSNFAAATFWNEVMGESYDTGSRLITLTEIKAAACLPWENDYRDPAKIQRAIRAAGYKYKSTALAIDWGGGGEERISFTSIALIGYLGGGKIDVLWGTRLLTPNDHLVEAARVIELWQQFQPDFIVHDATGAGKLRETILIATKRIPQSKILPFELTGGGKHIVKYVPPSDNAPRPVWRIDKTRTLQYTLAAMRMQLVRTFRYDNKGDRDPGLLMDFLALVEEKSETRFGSDSYTIRRDPGLSDDFAQAVNIGCAMFWYRYKDWPDLYKAAGTKRAAIEIAERLRAATEYSEDKLREFGHAEYGWEDIEGQAAPAEMFPND